MSPQPERMGGEAEHRRRQALSPGPAVRLPALRVVCALAFLIPGGLLVLVGLVLLRPWLRRLPAVLDRMGRTSPDWGASLTSRQPDGPETHEPSEHWTRVDITPKWGES